MAKLAIKKDNGDIKDFYKEVIQSINSDGYIDVDLKNNGSVCENNSTNTPLLAGETFTGLSGDILNYGVLILGVYSDTPSVTDGVKFDFSPDGTNWYNTDNYTYQDNEITKVYTITPVFRYYRIRYINGDSDQTSFNLQVILKKTFIKHSSHKIQNSLKDEDDGTLNISIPKLRTSQDTYISQAATIQGNEKISIEELESQISTNNNSQLKTSIYDYETGKGVNVESLGSLKTSTPVRLVGTTFSNGTKDTNFWTETVTGSGSITQSGEIILETGTTADSTAKYQTVSKARKITGTSNQFRLVGRQKETATTNCIRRAGPYDENNGFFFQYNGATFQVGSRKGGVDTLISNGSFNGNAGATISSDETEFTNLIIEYTALAAKFFVNEILLHTINAESTSLTNTLNLPITMEIINENGNTTDNGFEVLFATILRLGELDTENQYKFINTNTTTVCKYNAGRLRRIVNVDNAGTATIYDNTAASGTVIATIDTAKALGTLDFDIPFGTGLTVVTSLGAKVVVIYE